MFLLWHPWLTTTNPSYSFPILKHPPPPCAVLLVLFSASTLLVCPLFSSSALLLCSPLLVCSPLPLCSAPLFSSFVPFLCSAKFVEPIGIEHFFDVFSLEKKRPLKVDAASALNIPVNEVPDLLVVSQDKAKRFELTPVWAPAKTAEVRLSSASNVPIPPTKDDNEKGSSDEEDSDSSGSNSDVSSQDDSSDVPGTGWLR